MASHDRLRVTLNANQRRHYEVLFAGLERSLATIESAIRANHVVPSNSFTVVVPDLPDQFVSSAPTLLGRIRQTLQELHGALALSARPVSQRHTCRALLTSEIIRIEESYARGLRGYGEVDPSVAESLDPVLQAVRGDLADMAALLRGSPEARPA